LSAAVFFKPDFFLTGARMPIQQVMSKLLDDVADKKRTMDAFFWKKKIPAPHAQPAANACVLPSLSAQNHILASSSRHLFHATV
jgi:hypothetical protein